MYLYSVLQYAQATGNDNVLQNGSIRDLDLVSFLAHDNHGALELDALAKSDVARDCEVVELDDLGDLRDALLEVADLFEVTAQLDEGGAAEPARVHYERAVLNVVQIALDQEQVRARLHRQEPRPGDVDAAGVLEVANGGTDRGLELQNVQVHAAVLDGLGVGDDLHLELVVVDEALHGLEVDPQVVGVEVLELLDGLELLDVLLGDLGQLEQLDLPVVVNEGTTLDVGAGLVGELHDVLAAAVDDVLENVKVDGGAQIIAVGNKQHLLALGDQIVEDAGS